jgi:hypothetical protein
VTLRQPPLVALEESGLRLASLPLHAVPVENSFVWPSVISSPSILSLPTYIYLVVQKWSDSVVKNPEEEPRMTQKQFGINRFLQEDLPWLDVGCRTN